MKTKLFLLAFLCFGLPCFVLYPQAAREGGTGANPAGSKTADLPLRRIALFSSGVGFFEHSGTINSSPSSQAGILLPFDAAAVNDALKSLVINDPAGGGTTGASPSVRYASQDTLGRTLKSLKIDLSGSPGIGEILNGLKGAELEVSAPASIRGRIIGVEYRQKGTAVDGDGYDFPPVKPAEEAWLSLFTSQGIRAINVKDIASFRFIDEKINADLNRALDLIMASRDENNRNLLVTLGGSGSRTVSLSYVIPAPVWKVSYRLDLSGKAPFLQGWAIVDNDSDTDWEGVELSLVTGRPVSFIQNLYPPYRLTRPVIPLAIAGIAESRTYESGYGSSNLAEANKPEMEMAADSKALMRAAAPAAAMQAAPAPTVAGGTMDTAAGSAAGDQFQFTFKNPVTLERRQSAMLPLVEGSVKAEKTLVFSGSRAMGGASINPGISVELTNTSGMKLPAGPITVYDGGTYAGDALINFFPENEKRLITYGDDLSVSGNVTSSGTRYVTGVSVSGGVMTINRRQSYEKLYTIRNASGEAKKIIIEHPVTYGADLAEPKSAEDRTGTLYRFSRSLAAKGTLSFTVREETPVYERVTLAQLRPETFLSYSTNQEIPANVRAVLSQAIDLKKKADNAALAQKDLETQMTRLTAEQDRIRRNLEAAGNQSPQGQDYLKRLAVLDGDIDSLNRRIDAAMKETENTKKIYDNYIATVNL